MNEHIAQRIFFAILLASVTGAFLWVIRGFLQPIFWAVALGILVFPIHARLERALPNRTTLAAAASVILVVLIVIMPLIGVGMAVTAQANALYDRLVAGEIDLTQPFNELLENVPQLLAFMESRGIDAQRLESQVSSSAVELSQFVASRALAIGQNTLRITIYFFLMLYLLFYFLRDGQRILAAATRALPLGDERERLLLRRFAEVSRATLKGTLVVAIVQGTIGGVAFSVVGIGAPVLWGVAMAVLSIVPVVGSALVWFPAAVVLILDGQLIAGIVLILVGALIMGVVDNLLRPVLVGRDTRMPDYLILLSTLGGLAAFGLAGVVIGPIIAAFFLAVWRMASEEFSRAPMTASASDDLAAARQHDQET